MSDDTITPPDSRRDRLHARRRRHRVFWILGIGAIVAAAATVTAFALTDTTSSQSPARAAGKNTDKELPLAAATKTEAARPLSHAQPLKLWIGGDSLAGSFGPSLGDMTGATGVVSTEIDYKVSSGLASNDLRNWQQRATQQMASVQPDAVVFIIGANDASIVNKVDADHDGVPDWDPIYRAKVDQMMDTFVGGNLHRTVYWIGAPTMGSKLLDDGVVELDRVMREEAAKRAPDVTFIDGYKLFSGPDGGYSSHLTDANGKVFLARISDGVHFTANGAQYLASALFKLIDAHWHMTKQADTAHPIDWHIAPGSGEAVPGFSSNPTSHVGRHRSSSTPTSNASYSPPSTESAPPTSVVVIEPTTVAPPTTVGTPETTAPPPPPTTTP